MIRQLFTACFMLCAANGWALGSPAAGQDSLLGAVFTGERLPGPDTSQRQPGAGEGNDVAVDQQPAIVKKANPTYPLDAITKGLEGEVWLKLQIDEKGKVAQCSVVKSTDEMFNQSALDAAKQFEFTPAYKGKNPVAVWVTLPFRFKLAEKGAASKCTKAYQAVIQGADPQTYRAMITPGARLIDGGSMENLLEAAQRQDKAKVFGAEPARKSSLLQLNVHEGEGIGVGTWETRDASGGSPRYHTVVFQKSQDGKWMIQQWHTSR